MVDRSILSNDLKICVSIYEHDKVLGDKTWLSKLVRELEGEMSRMTISKTLDKLFDLGIIDGHWERTEGKWTRVFQIAGESEDFVRGIYEKVSKA